MAVLFEWINEKRYRRVHVGERVCLVLDAVAIGAELKGVELNPEECYSIPAGAVEELLDQIEEEVLV